MFIDRTKIRVVGGHGGNGVTAFRREKFVPRGGPSGGDGGRGGDVWLVSDESVNTLLHLRYNPLHVAGRGRHGEGSNRSGKEGDDVIVRVPVGTQVFDPATDELLFDFDEDGQRWRAARGGRGGFGNAHFATSTNRAPRYHQEGSLGEEGELQLELKLLADVGLVGFPNAGKSTFISTVSAAKPKIADYPFTTLEPHLGVVDLGDFRTFVIADIPGLSKGRMKATAWAIAFCGTSSGRRYCCIWWMCRRHRDAIRWRIMKSSITSWVLTIPNSPRVSRLLSPPRSTRLTNQGGWQRCARARRQMAASSSPFHPLLVNACVN